MTGKRPYIAIDVGGTAIRVVLFDVSHKIPQILSRAHFKHGRNYEIDMPRLIDSIRSLEGFESKELKGIGLGIAGVVYEGTITDSGNLSAWHHQPIRKDLSSEFSVPVRLISDAAAAAHSEAAYGHGTDRDFWFVISGTGVGGAYTRRTRGGYEVFSQEPGHMTIGQDRLCGCGLTGCLEAYVGGNGLERHYNVESAGDLTEAQWMEYCKNLAIGTNNLMNVFGAPLVVFGGGVILNQSHLLPHVGKLLAERAMRPLPELQTATHGHDAGLYGALALVAR